MGYMGLSSVCDSDMASDLAHSAIKAQVKVLKKGLREIGNCFNTSGPENVGLFFEEFIIPAYRGVICDELYELAQETSDALQKTIDITRKADWDDMGNKLIHLKAYQRMKRKIDKFIKDNNG